MKFQFSNAHAIVTGATSGIGLAITERLVARGATVLAVGRRQQRLDELATRWGAAIIPAAIDLTAADAPERIASMVDQRWSGSLQLLVNNAGAGAIGLFADAPPRRLREIFEINFFAVAELTRRLIPTLTASSPSTICNIGSVLGHCAVPEKSEYCAAKFALHGWNDSLQMELQSQGVDVVMVSPSTTRSEFFDSLIDSDESAKSRSIGSWSTQQVADATIKAIERRRRESILSLGGKALVFANRVFPTTLSNLLSRPRST